ncbi:MAG: sigma-70 family RNA polymerase sigma factor [Cyclobacteriaceae bacterium]|nr:sigma-70 family RNA polymerase sigma factor [Cyclobacteriaceae bacterium]
MKRPELHSLMYAQSERVQASSKESRFANCKDEDIWNLFKDGDEEAFVYIYNHYFKALYNYGHHLIKDSEEVKDQIQDLFIYIRAHRSGLGQVKNIRFYLYTSLRRRLLGKNLQGSFLQLIKGDHELGFEISLESSPEQKWIEGKTDEDRMNQLETGLNKLTTRQREAILHFYYEGLSYEEVARLMQLNNTKSARKLIYRALDTLKSAFFKNHSVIFAPLMAASTSFLF